MKHNNCPTNYFTGSVYKTRLETSDDVVRWFTTCPAITDIWYQLEKGTKGNEHWQYTFKTRGKQQRYSHWWRTIKGWKVGEWIDGARKKDACINYCHKASTRIAGPFEWHLSSGAKPVKGAHVNVALHSWPASGPRPADPFVRALQDKVQEIRMWRKFLQERPVVNKAN